MSINYYLFCRESYDKIINDLDNITNILEEIDEYIKEENNLLQSDIVLENQSHNKLFFSNRKQHIKVLKIACEKKIMELCNHQFIEDSIDITPDKSQIIRYCSICEYTDPNK
jgi:hypothetical protein